MATHFSLSYAGGFFLTDVMGQSCGSSCRIGAYRSKHAGTGIVDLVMVRCRTHFLDLAMFPGFDGIVSHSAHEKGYDSLHLIWKSMRVLPA